MNLTLTIKRIYFQQIADGTKVVEYRRDSPFYKSLFADRKKWTSIVFHFYRSERLKCQVVEIKKIRRPKQFKESTYLTTPWVWGIFLSQPKTFSAGVK